MQLSGRQVLLIFVAIVAVGYFLMNRPDEPEAADRPTQTRADRYVEEYGGSRTAIQQILGYDDCDTLQRTFDAAEANFQAFGAGTPRAKEQLGRMAAADDRMDAIGCY